jgi:hypothetical protein
MRNESLEKKIIAVQDDFELLSEREKDFLLYDALFIKEYFDKDYLASALSLLLYRLGDDFDDYIK